MPGQAKPLPRDSPGRKNTSYGTVGDDGGEKGVSQESSTRVVVLVVLLCTLLFGEGYDYGVINGVMVILQEEWRLTTWEMSMAATATPFCVMLTAPFAGVLADGLGRRKALMIACIILALGPMIMFAATTYAMLVAGRSVVGIGVGVGIITSSMYISEIAPTSRRGQLVCVQDVALQVGLLGGYIVNWALLGKDAFGYRDWRWMLGFGTVVPLLVLVGLLVPNLVPETPRWLLARNRREEATRVLIVYTGEQEAKNTLRDWDAQQQAEGKEEFVGWGEVLWPSDPLARRRMGIGLLVSFVQILCGVLGVAVYSSLFLKKEMGARAAFMGTMLMGTAKVLVALTVVLIVERAGRRPLLLASILGCTLASFWLYGAFGFSWGPLMLILGFILFMASHSLGLGPIFFVYVAEIFPTRIRGKAFGVCLGISRLGSVCTTLFYPVLADHLTVAGLFLGQGVVNFIFSILLWAFVRETHGHSLEEMEKVFKNAGFV